MGQASIRAGSGWSYSVGSRVNIVLDGQSLLTPDRSSIRWQYLPMENVGQVEVLKGASSILYGSSAMNGTIVLSTIKPTSKPETKFVSYIGVLDEYENKAYNWWGRNRIKTGGYFSHAQKVNDRFEYVIGLNGNYSELPYEGYTDYHIRNNLYTRWMSKKDMKSSYGFRYNFTHYKESEFIFWKGPDEESLVPIESIVYKYYNFNIDPYYIKYDKKDNRHELKTRLYYYQPNNGIKGGYANIDYQFIKRWDKGWNLIAGASQELLLAYDNDFTPNLQKAYKWAIYSQVDKKFNKISLTAGLRSEVFLTEQIVGAAYAFVKNNETTGEVKEIPLPLMRMGLNYKPRKNTFVRFNIGQAFRLPSILEYAIEFEFSGICIKANPDLRPEYGWTSELGFKQNWQSKKKKIYAGSFDVAFFWQEYKDLVEFVVVLEDGDICLVPENLPTARIAGYEISLKQNITKKSHEMNIDFGYTYAFPVQLSNKAGSDLKNPGAYLKSLFKYAGRIENTPQEVRETALLKYRNRHLVNVNLDYDNDFFHFGFYARYYSYIENGDFEFDNPPAISFIPGIKDYWSNKFPFGDFVADLNFGFKFTEHHSIAINIKNFTNREYSLRLAKIEPPRSFTWQYKLTL